MEFKVKKESLVIQEHQDLQVRDVSLIKVYIYDDYYVSSLLTLTNSNLYKHLLPVAGVDGQKGTPGNQGQKGFLGIPGTDGHPGFPGFPGNGGSVNNTFSFFERYDLCFYFMYEKFKCTQVSPA